MADFLRWHRLFGIALTDLFTDTPWRVELEKELALSSQLLDVAIIARTAEMAGPGAVAAELPDGVCFGPEDRLRGLTPEELRRLRDYLNTLN